MAMSKMSPSLAGLTAAVNPNDDDPLGTNLKRQGMDVYYADRAQSDPRFASGPLPDPAWEGLFQALANRGISKVGQEAVQSNGIADTPGFATSGDVGALAPPVNPNTLSAADLDNYRTMQSNNIAQTPQFQQKKAKR